MSEQTGGFCGDCHNHSTLTWDEQEKAWMSSCCGDISEPYGEVDVDYFQGSGK